MPLLPKSSKLVKLAIKESHQPGHLGVLATASKVRTKLWSPNLLRNIKSVLKFCTGCRLYNKERASQLMGSATEERLNPSLPFTNLCNDLFGPYNVRSNLKKTSLYKIYAAIFTCLLSRAVHLDIVMDYSTKFLQTFRFASLRGFPEVIHSDSGTQLIGANKALQGSFKHMNDNFLIKEFIFEGLRWEFAPGCAPWQQACTESLISSVKKCLFFAIGNQVLSLMEMQTTLFEVENLLIDWKTSDSP